MRPDPRVAGYLSQALSHEMTAVQQYLTQSSLCEIWRLGEYAAYFRLEAEEELVHASQLIQRMLYLGQVPNQTRLAPVRPGRDLVEMLHIDRALERDAILLYQEAWQYSQRVRDLASAELFANLLRDEQHHLQELEQRLATLTHPATAPTQAGPKP